MKYCNSKKKKKIEITSPVNELYFYTQMRMNIEHVTLYMYRNQFGNIISIFSLLFTFISSYICCRLLCIYTISRVSLTYRVKSAHKVKLTDKQLLQWMVPILLVMLIYLGTWTLSATPSAEVVSIMTIQSTLFSQFSVPSFTIK